ncbi:von Willebrand factor D and EGF domain-containing protein [Eumeta japonica]|uniref:von Willebrand factor D and EGF domain-containing protein n=1 Tax=Eumeta variegata TaxID=151549 RepID=A0A4C1Z5F1_EUMVA|nr:von Willebrand factor D and EGF domain-containing protein [Eumeta japonica]
MQMKPSQSDVGAPAYAPYVKTNRYSNYGGAKRSYSGTKTGMYGTKTVYSGTKTGSRKGYGGTKTGYSGYGHYYNYNAQTTPSYESFRDNAAINPYKPVCNPDCKNNGICMAQGVCQCPDNFFGNYCEFEKIPCMTHPPTPMNSQKRCSSEMCTIQCLPGHQFIDGTSAANLCCENGQWRPTRADLTSIPDCVPICEPPCLNGGACLSLNVCQCPSAY